MLELVRRLLLKWNPFERCFSYFHFFSPVGPTVKSFSRTLPLPDGGNCAMIQRSILRYFWIIGYNFLRKYRISPIIIHTWAKSLINSINGLYPTYVDIHSKHEMDPIIVIKIPNSTRISRIFSKISNPFFERSLIILFLAFIGRRCLSPSVMALWFELDTPFLADNSTNSFPCHIIHPPGPQFHLEFRIHRSCRIRAYPLSLMVSFHSSII